MNTAPYNRDEIVARALASTRNTPYYCQLWTREMCGAPSAGDQDGDGDSDAVDGWFSEPKSARHPGDRNPPAGVPVAWAGGSSGFGHRAISLGGGKIRSTDANGLGWVGTVPLAWVEQNWGLRYLGWSETCTGYLIPEAPKPPKKTRGKHVKAALAELRQARGKGKRGQAIRDAIKALLGIGKK